MLGLDAYEAEAVTGDGLTCQAVMSKLTETAPEDTIKNVDAFLRYGFGHHGQDYRPLAGQPIPSRHLSFIRVQS